MAEWTERLVPFGLTLMMRMQRAGLMSLATSHIFAG
jgi:hypothetical protein